LAVNAPVALDAVHVTAVGAGAARCKVLNWSSPAQNPPLVWVGCFIAGAATDSEFALWAGVYATSVV
jgi:hypothetical protein